MSEPKGAAWKPRTAEPVSELVNYGPDDSSPVPPVVTEYFCVELFVPELDRWWWSGTRYPESEVFTAAAKASLPSRVVRVTETREVIGGGNA